MFIESDLLIAYMKREDWLKETATKVIDAIEKGKIRRVQASTEVFHELYYVFSNYDPLSIILTNLTKIATIENLNFVKPSPSVYLLALNLMETYDITSIFDAIYAATVLGGDVPDKTIISTDETYRIKGIKRINPKNLKI